MASDSCDSGASLRKYLDDLITFLDTYLPLANRNTIDFFLEDLWLRCIPIQIRHEVMSLPEQYRLSLGSYPIMNSTELPIKEYDNLVDDSYELDIKWKHSSLKDFVNEARRIYQNSIGPDVVSELDDVFEELQCTEREDSIVDIKHMISPKKIHEVEVMADFCSRVAGSLDVPAIVDLGSGKGYLGTTLAFAYQHNVLGIDCSESNTKGALTRSQKIDKKLKNRRDKQGASTSLMTYKASTQYVTGDTDFTKMIHDHFPQSLGERCLLTGLHTCGNLAAYSLRIFVENSTVGGVCNVGCCYEHLTQEGEITASGDRPISGFPMSGYLKGREINLVKQVRSLASQPLARIADGVLRPSKSLFWRAVLQVLLTDQNGGQSRDTWMVGKAGNKCGDFVSYCRKALEKLGKTELSKRLSDEELLVYESRYADLEPTIYAFYQLRIVLSPLIESLILLDRLLYLKEQASVESSHLIRLFNPVTSPRCFALVAWKNKNEAS